MNFEYNGNNISNLINSIKSFCSCETNAQELIKLKGEDLKKYDNIVLFLVDGLGYNWMEKYGKGSFLHSKLHSSMFGVFPSTTSSSITTFSTGYTPSEHAVMGRNFFSKEFSSIIQILPWKNKITNTSLGDRVNIEDILVKDNFYKNSSKDVFIVTSELFKNSKYNLHYNKGAKVLEYKNLDTLFSQTLNAINYNKKQKYIYSYWPDFDTLCHDYGIDSNEVKNHFEDIDYHFEKLKKDLEGTNTLVIVTADHGQINCDKIIDIKKDYKNLHDMLLLPLAGETRFSYCFVKEGFKDEFYSFVKNNLSEFVDIYTKSEVLEMNLFGYSREEKFLERIGDFLILAKDGYLITDGTDGIHLGNHGGTSSWEIKIPLIYF